MEVRIQTLEAAVGKYIKEFYENKQIPRSIASPHLRSLFVFVHPIIRRIQFDTGFAHLTQVHTDSKENLRKCVPAGYNIRGKAYCPESKQFLLDKGQMINLQYVHKHENVREYIDNIISISKKAGKLGVGPQIHDAYVCTVNSNTESTAYLLAMRSDYIEGKSLMQLYKSRRGGGSLTVANKAKIIELLRAKLELLHKHHILASDFLIEDSVIVTFDPAKKSVVKDVFIINYVEAMDMRNAAKLQKEKNMKNLKWIFDSKGGDENNLEDYVTARLLDDKVINID